MTRIAYRDMNLREGTLRTIGCIGALAEEYRSQGLRLSVRQVHYQFVSRGWAANNGRTYDHVQDCINKGRLCGLLDWEMFEDRERELMGHRTFASPAHAVAALAHAEQLDPWSYRTDLWAGQPFRPEVWVEKLALVGVIGDICNELRVDFYAQKGYNSQSEQWRAGQRFARYVRTGQRPIVFHLGDHDPSGMDMTRDNRDRLSEFACTPIMVQRLALNYTQIEQYNPPENFAKTTDVRIDNYQAYMESIGADPTVSWELDALDPRVIRDLIQDAVDRVRDEKKWELALAQEVEDRRVLAGLVEEMGGIEEEDD